MTERTQRGGPLPEPLQNLLDNLPEPTRKPCAECPWRRDSTPGYLGPHTASEWVNIAHQDGPIACHMTIDHDDQDWSELKQCAGSAIFRANVSKRPRHPKVSLMEPDTRQVFATNSEFKLHHQPIVATIPPAFSWASQVVQYPKVGEPGIHLFRGNIPGQKPVLCLCWRDDAGLLRGVLNYYQETNQWEQEGNANLFIDPEWERKGIGTELLLHGIQVFRIDLGQQRFTKQGAAFVNRLIEKGVIR